jgi:DNA polymerase/3'-5' exonuclease PolX
VTVSDPRESALPDVGLLEIEDAETGAVVLVDTGSKEVRNRYEKLARQKKEKLRNLFKSTGVDHIELYTDRDYVLDLVKFFRKRIKKESRG